MIWTASGEQLELERFPYPGTREHRAWDASDELLFENPAFLAWSTRGATGMENSAGDGAGVGQNAGDAAGLRNILMFDDDHGSLALAAAGFLAGVRIWLVSDSLLTHRAVIHNDPGDGRGEQIVPVPLPEAFSPSHNAASDPAYSIESVEFHAVIMKLPKSAAMFEIYCDLVRLRAPGRPLWIGGMSKRWSPAVRSLEESFFIMGTAEKFRRRGRWVYHPEAGHNAEHNAGHNSEKTAEQNNRPATREYRFNSRLYSQSAGIYSSSAADAGSVLLLSAILSHYQAPLRGQPGTRKTAEAGRAAAL
ncbi:hypothetical protein [Salinispira pacifica]|uniref:RlmG N-terminal domain-containing protein n=1 Tax=Salinispira pacifica TaxID=1307761 RepID=V5WIV8_9SPIO|nr:hypothetical protein [Salinispira pacifica]AHC15494.1 hypothetical protein L21SP2_2127 [Salinispira pacifica]